MDFHRPTGKEVYQQAVVEPVKVIPAVILGLLLNILDGVSYDEFSSYLLRPRHLVLLADSLSSLSSWFQDRLRMITFPANLIFTDFGSIGVSMFFMSCIVSQLTFSLRGSIFKGGNGSMMIEAVPFFHIIVGVITAKVGEDKVSLRFRSLSLLHFSFRATRRD